MPIRTQQYDVLIVGAGPSGLATALSAARHGAHVLVVERHPGLSVHPRASGTSTRTMEIFRGWGLVREVRAASADITLSAGSGETLTDPELAEVSSGWPGPRQTLAVSPEFPAACAQDLLEPILLAHVRRAGGQVRFSTRLAELRTGADGVQAVLTDLATGAGISVGARYVVGADGVRSTVRSSLGIGVDHLGTVGDFAQVLFHADLSGALRGRRFAYYGLTHPTAGGLLLPFGPDRWGFARQWYPERGERAADFSREGWTGLLRTATGIPQLRPQITGWTTFTLAAELAAAYRAGRGFLAGDAAHRMTPFGALGLNTAVQDGHNLGWKLAWVSRGLAGEGLLDSYPAEREPVGRRNTLRSLYSPEKDPADALANDLGSRYQSAALADGGHPLLGYGSPGLAAARPGERAPHVWLSRRGSRVSTHDVFGGRLTLVAGREAQEWHRAADAVAKAGVPMGVLAAGVLAAGADGAREPDALTSAYRLGESGAVLVRPDGYVAWRSDAVPRDAVAALNGAVAVALGLKGLKSADDFAVSGASIR